MYGKGGGELLAAVPTTVAGVAVLPNTGGNPVLLALSLISTTIGSLVIVTTLIRMIAKRAYKTEQ